MPASPVHPRLAENRARFGHRVAALRQGREWTQEQLAEASGFDRKTINRIENGRHAPSLDRVFVLADALNVPPVELFTWADS
ncbi:helix-turn-helix domain-containing protein [Actinokineospora sp. UTMC 2448]|uniref:helix-turn-helix domain-containing protein n=1 Tax=Actinokineospora sp. UTMC 2448 TaxID=2268449 RepID=UPI002164A51E|nr:helix-turn-helix transcriptional regulator [Actinokineospora sp. UTMC 2448]